MIGSNPRTMSVTAMLRAYCDLLEELRRRGIVRSTNNPVADYSELLFCEAFGWSRERRSNLGFDATCDKGLRYEIKGRRLTPTNQSRQLGSIRKLPDRQFDFLAGVLFHDGFAIKRGALVPHSNVEARARYREHPNAWLFELKDEVWSEAGVVDVTDMLQLAAERLG